MPLPKVLPTEPFTADEVAHITEVVFGAPSEPTSADANEADVIAQHLVENGVSPEAIVKEARSTNSLENVTFLCDEIRSRGVASLVCVCKSFAVGRQSRTIKKHLPGVAITVVGFDTDPEEGLVLSRDDWSKADLSRGHIWAEYVRNCLYARNGDILADFQPPLGLGRRLADLEKSMRGGEG